MNKNLLLVCYYSVYDPNISLDYLKFYEISEVDFIEIAFKANNSFLYCIIIAEHAKVMIFIHLLIIPPHDK